MFNHNSVNIIEVSYNSFKEMDFLRELSHLIRTNIDLGRCKLRLDNHTAVILCKDKFLVGGLTYQVFRDGESIFDRRKTFSYIKHEREIYAQLEYLVVKSEYRCLGFGKYLLIKTEERLKEKGIEEIVTNNVIDENSAPIILKELNYIKSKKSNRYKKII